MILRSNSRLLIIALAMLLSHAFAQDTLRIGDSFNKIDAGRYIHYFNTPDTISADSALKTFNSKKVKTSIVSDPHLGIVSGDFWFSFHVKNSTDEDLQLILEISNPHLVSVSFYEATSRVVAKGTMGMFHPFNQRPVKHRYFVLPFSLSTKQSTQILIQITQENSMVVPFTLWDASAFYQNDYNQNLRFGIFFGFLCFCALLTIICFIMIRERVLLWYFLYVVFAGLYLFYDTGASFQYIYPSIPYIDAPLGIQLPVLMFIFLIKFSQSFLNIGKYNRVINYALHSLVVFFIAVLLLINFVLFGVGLWFLPVLFITMFIGLCLLVIAGFQSIKINKLYAFFYLGATGSVIFAGMYHILAASYGLLSPTTNPLFAGILVEIVLLTTALIVQYSGVQRERAVLKIELAHQQNRMLEQYIQGIDMDRERIATDLHDDIGSRLGHMKRAYFSGEEHSQGEKEMNDIIEELRRISHNLAPTISPEIGLIKLTEILISKARIDSGIDFKLQLYCQVENLTNEQTIQAYRIMQEAIHNIVRHSKASHADIQFFGYADQLVISIEDDGIGFNATEKKGFGLNHMQMRAHALNGKIEINSFSEKGCMIIVEIPYKGSNFVFTPE